MTSGETGKTDEAVLCLADSEEKENCNKLQGYSRKIHLGKQRRKTLAFSLSSPKGTGCSSGLRGDLLGYK